MQDCLSGREEFHSVNQRLRQLAEQRKPADERGSAKDNPLVVEQEVDEKGEREDEEEHDEWEEEAEEEEEEEEEEEDAEEEGDVPEEEAHEGEDNCEDEQKADTTAVSSRSKEDITLPTASKAATAAVAPLVSVCEVRAAQPLPAAARSSSRSPSVPRVMSREPSANQPVAQQPAQWELAQSEHDELSDAYYPFDEEDERDTSGSSDSGDSSEDSDSSGSSSPAYPWGWRRAPSCHYGDEEYASSYDAGADAVSQLSSSVYNLSSTVAAANSVLLHLSNNVEQLSAQLRERLRPATTRASRCAELGWPAASMSLLTVLLVLLSPLCLPFMWRDASEE